METAGDVVLHRLIGELAPDFTNCMSEVAHRPGVPQAMTLIINYSTVIKNTPRYGVVNSMADGKVVSLLILVG